MPDTVTVAEVDAIIAMTEWLDPDDKYRRRAHNALVRVRPLVEEAEYKRRIEELECEWHTGSRLIDGQAIIWVSCWDDATPRTGWDGALAWAEAQAAARKPPEATP